MQQKKLQKSRVKPAVASAVNRRDSSPAVGFPIQIAQNQHPQALSDDFHYGHGHTGVQARRYTRRSLHLHLWAPGTGTPLGGLSATLPKPPSGVPVPSRVPCCSSVSRVPSAEKRRVVPGRPIGIPSTLRFSAPRKPHACG